MAISHKVKGLLSLKGKNYVGLANYMGIAYQTILNKFSRNSFSADDLVNIAAFIGCDLAFISEDGTKIVLDKDDLRRKEKKNDGTI